MALVSLDTLLIKSDEDAASLTHLSYVTNPRLVNYLQCTAGMSHSSRRATRAHRNVFVGQAGTFCGAGSKAGRVSQFLPCSELSRSQQTHFMQTHIEAKARKDM